MELILLRDRPLLTATLGQLFIGSNLECYTVERPLSASTAGFFTAAIVAIPKGRYRVELLQSPRAVSGTLYTPDINARLLTLYGVPGRTDILIHAGNSVTDTIGCVLVGKTRSSTTLVDSRLCLASLMSKVQDPCYITIIQP